MKAIIIVNQFNEHNEHKIKRFFEESKSLDLELEVVVNDGTIAKIVNGNIDCHLQCDFIIYLDKDYYLARMLEKAGYTVFPDSHFLKICDDKMLTFVECSQASIRMPKTISSPLVFGNVLREENYQFLEKVVKELSFPLIMKRVYGSLGKGVYLIKDYETLKKRYSKYFMEPLLFQEYIETSFGKSIRVLVIDGKIFGAFERYNNGDFRSNYGNKASGKKIELSEKYRLFAEKIIKLLDIHYAGIDLLYGPNDEPVLCEINSNAFFHEFEKVTRKNAARAYLEMVLKLYEQK